MYALNTLKQIVSEHQKDLKKDLGVERNFEIKLLERFATIVSGIRRCGKSTFARQFLKNKTPIYYTYFEDLALADFELKDFAQLEKAFKELYGDKGIFFFDEIQNITGWEKYVRQLADKGEKILITGSNASMLSKELGMKLTGRHLSFELYPFSYGEFLSLHEKQHNIKLYQKYLVEGGFPEYLKNKDNDILRNLIQDIYYRDIVARNEIRNVAEMKSMLQFLLSNIGREISYNKLKDIIKIKSTNTITKFINYFEDAYLLFSIKKYDYSLKKQLINPKKIYCVDNGLVTVNAFSFSENKGRLLENGVFIELKRRNKEIYYHRDKHECNFLIKTRLSITDAIQVCYEVDESNKEREINGVLEALNKYKLKKGMILTFNQEDKLIIDKKTIIIKPVWKWMLE